MNSSRPVSAYPSRVEARPRLIKRLDPVVHGVARADTPLSHAQADFYARNGYLHLQNVFSPAEVSSLQQALNQLRADTSAASPEEVVTEPGSNDVRSVFRVHAWHALFARLARDARLTSIARFILGSDIYVHQSRVNFKPGFAGKEFYWHSDFETWHMEDGMPRMRALSMSISLAKNTEFNGPLMLVPGSHETFVSCVGETPDDHYKSSLRKQEFGVPDPESLHHLVDEGGLVSAKGPAGSVTIFDCNTMHGSSSNISPLPRANVFVVYNSIQNTLSAPFGGTKPRPEFLAARRDVKPIVPEQGFFA